MARQNEMYQMRKGVETQFAFSQAIKSGDMLFISGSVSWDQEGNPLATGDMASQIKNVYQDLKKTLEDNGMTFEHVVKETVFTRDMDALVENSDVRKAFYDGVAPPASTWITTPRLVHPDLLIEVEIIAKK